MRRPGSRPPAARLASPARRRALQRAAGLGEEDVVERGRVQAQVGDREALGVERPHDLREVADALGQLRGDAAGRGRGLLAEAVQHALRGARGRRGLRGSPRRSGRPIAAFSSAGVPSATILPRSMIPTRSASTSASSRYCVVRNTVTPSSARRRTSSHSAARLCGSRPVVGSSRNSSRGRCTSARPRSSRRFIPPE